MLLDFMRTQSNGNENMDTVPFHIHQTKTFKRPPMPRAGHHVRLQALFPRGRSNTGWATLENILTPRVKRTKAAPQTLGTPTGLCSPTSPSCAGRVAASQGEHGAAFLLPAGLEQWLAGQEAEWGVSPFPSSPFAGPGLAVTMIFQETPGRLPAAALAHSWSWDSPPHPSMVLTAPCGVSPTGFPASSASTRKTLPGASPCPAPVATRLTSPGTQEPTSRGTPWPHPDGGLQKATHADARDLKFPQSRILKSKIKWVK